MLSLLLMLGLATSGTAQVHKGSWFGIDYDRGVVLSGRTSAVDRGLISNDVASNLGLTLGYNFSPRWSIGAGLSAIVLPTPDHLGLLGVHLTGQVRPMRSRPRFVLETRLGSTIFASTSSASGFDANPFGHISIGWELRRLIGPIGIVPSIGVRYVDLSRINYGSLDLAEGRSQSEYFIAFASLSLVFN